ncbi:hypothetical protein ACFLU5_11825 [Bacteroidota bacterium]
MNRYIRSILFIGLPLAIMTYLFYQGQIWSVNHVSYINAGQPHPLNCISCHVTPQREGFLADLLNDSYLSPLNIAVSSNGNKLYITAQDGNALIVADVNSGKVITKIPVGNKPHSVILSRDEELAYVSNQWSNNIYIIDLIQYEVIDTIMVGGGPAGFDLDAEGKYLYVANTYTSDLSIIDLDSRQEIRRLLAGNKPMAVDIAPDEQTVYISSRRTIPVPFRTPPKTELTVVDANSKRVVDRKYITSAHIMENVTFTPSGDLAFVTLVRPKNLVPSTQVEQGWMMNHGIGVIEHKEGGRVAQFLLDEPNRFFADPFDVIFSKDGKHAFISHSGFDHISVINVDVIRELLAKANDKDLANYANHLGLSYTYVEKRIPTGPNPKGMALSPGGDKLYVAERYADQISVFDTKTYESVGQIDLGGPKKVTVVRHGARLFSNSSRTFHNQYSCYTCHPDGHEDGLTYDLVGSGRNLANVQTLRDLAGTSPFKWNGKNVSVYMQCGMRFSTFVTRTEVFPPEDLDALVAYIKRELTHPPNLYQLPDNKLSPAQQRGKGIFERTHDNYENEIPVDNRCITCHPPPNFTDKQMSNVGTIKETDDFLLLDAPNLNNIYESAPYLHDGSAASLEEIWTVFAGQDEHGVVNDMTKDQLNDLIEYLRSLGPERNYRDVIILKSEL